MNQAEKVLSTAVQKALAELYAIQNPVVSLQKTRKEFEGDFTLVTFAFTKESKKTPEALGEELGKYLVQNTPEVAFCSQHHP